MPDVYENPFTASLLDFFEQQQNARRNAPWASETPATWSDGSPIMEMPNFGTAPYSPSADDLDWLSKNPPITAAVDDGGLRDVLTASRTTNPIFQTFDPYALGKSSIFDDVAEGVYNSGDDMVSLFKKLKISSKQKTSQMRGLFIDKLHIV